MRNKKHLLRLGGMESLHLMTQRCIFNHLNLPVIRKGIGQCPILLFERDPSFLPRWGYQRLYTWVDLRTRAMRQLGADEDVIANEIAHLIYRVGLIPGVTLADETVCDFTYLAQPETRTTPYQKSGE